MGLFAKNLRERQKNSTICLRNKKARKLEALKFILEKTTILLETS